MKNKLLGMCGVALEVFIIGGAAAITIYTLFWR
jgi:hypothetical protein